MSRELLVVTVVCPSLGVLGWMLFRALRAVAIIRSVDEVRATLYSPVRGVDETIPLSEITYHRTVHDIFFQGMILQAAVRRYWINVIESGKENVEQL